MKRSCGESIEADGHDLVSCVGSHVFVSLLMSAQALIEHLVCAGHPPYLMPTQLANFHVLRSRFFENGTLIIVAITALAPRRPANHIAPDVRLH